MQNRHGATGLTFALLSAATFAMSGPLASALINVGWTPRLTQLGPLPRLRHRRRESRNQQDQSDARADRSRSLPRFISG